MSSSSRLSVTVNLGPNASMSTVSAVVADLNVICQFTGRLQEQVARGQALSHVLHNPAEWIKDVQAFTELPQERIYVPLNYAEELMSPSIEQAVARYLRDRHLLDARAIYVERITYGNPFIAIFQARIEAIFKVALEALPIIRNWSADKKSRIAEVNNYEHALKTQMRLREHYANLAISGEIALSPNYIEGLVTGEVAGAFFRLCRADVEVREIHDEPDED